MDVQTRCRTEGGCRACVSLPLPTATLSKFPPVSNLQQKAYVRYCIESGRDISNLISRRSSRITGYQQPIKTNGFWAERAQNGHVMKERMVAPSPSRTRVPFAIAPRSDIYPRGRFRQRTCMRLLPKTWKNSRASSDAAWYPRPSGSRGNIFPFAGKRWAVSER